MADAGIAIWESKFYYDFWRPVTGIREVGRGHGAAAAPATATPRRSGDADFSPLGAPASNLHGPEFHAAVSALPVRPRRLRRRAVPDAAQRSIGTDHIAFTFVSDEFNGVTVGNDGNVRPLVPRSFTSLSQAEEENGQSRIYLGIHWAFDKTAGHRAGTAGRGLRVRERVHAREVIKGLPAVHGFDAWPSGRTSWGLTSPQTSWSIGPDAAKHWLISDQPLRG